MNCKHNWREIEWHKRPLVLRDPSPREYYYLCSRCSESRFVKLTEKKKP